MKAVLTMFALIFLLAFMTRAHAADPADVARACRVINQHSKQMTCEMRYSEGNNGIMVIRQKVAKLDDQEFLRMKKMKTALYATGGGIFELHRPNGTMFSCIGIDACETKSVSASVSNSGQVIVADGAK